MTTPLPPKDALLAKLHSTRQDVLDAIAGLSDEQLTQPMTPDGPSVREVLAHLQLWDWAKVDLLQQRAAGGTPAIVALDDDVDAANAQATATWRDQPLPALFAALDQTRAEYLAAIAALTDADLAAPCGPPYDASVSLLQVLEGTVEHNAEHAEELAAWSKSLERDA
jgi:uncharacterized damage-inducible protein DinB